MHEKFHASRESLIDKIIDERNCDTLQERRDHRAKLRGMSYDELAEQLNKLRARRRPK